ncbi:hypothetical protein P886_3523 [Alteromonadaceae bacterium 2753L.S.0a.02]|nr:hypothetical protein P886_3523 [Alteromonadaceae bacterium 2753L.S.0a.02]
MVRSKNPVKTPCIGVCSTGIGDSVCRGCKRFCHEIIDWNSYGIEQQDAVLKRLQLLLGQVVRDKFIVLNEVRLKAQLQHQQIRYNSQLDSYCWIFDLLNAGASQIQDFAEFGIAVNSQWTHKTPLELRELIDADFYALSCAHYQRYFLM